MSDCALRARVLRVRLLPLGNELSQRLVGALRWNDVNLDQLIAAPALLATRHALAAQPQLRTLLGALRYLDVDRPVDRIDAHARSVERLAERHRQRTHDIVPLALETGVRPDRYLDVGVARLAVGARQALPLETQHLRIVDPRRD